jgi:hypothetical protein
LRMIHLPLRCSSEFIKAFGIRGRNCQAISLSDARANTRPPAVQNSSSGTIAFKCMGKKNACAHQAHHRCNRLDHRTNPLRPRNPQNDSIVAQSKRFTGRNRRSAVSDDLLQQIVRTRHRKVATNGAYTVNRSAGPRKSTGTQSNHSFTTREQIIHYARAHPISAVFRLRYLHDVMRRWVASWGKAAMLQRRQSAAENGNWGRWGFDGQ